VREERKHSIFHREMLRTLHHVARAAGRGVSSAATRGMAECMPTSVLAAAAAAPPLARSLPRTAAAHSTLLPAAAQLVLHNRVRRAWNGRLTDGDGLPAAVPRCCWGMRDDSLGCGGFRCPHGGGCTRGEFDLVHRRRANVASRRGAVERSIAQRVFEMRRGLTSRGVGRGCGVQLTTSARREAADADVNPLTTMPRAADAADAAPGEGAEGKDTEEVVQMAPICNSREGPGKARAFLRNARISPNKMKDACDLVRPPRLPHCQRSRLPIHAPRIQPRRVSVCCGHRCAAPSAPIRL